MGELPVLDADSVGHVPVLLEETLAALAVRAGGVYIDATVGGGGHAAAILEQSAPWGRLLALDRDPHAAVRAAARLKPFGERVRVIHAAYAHLAKVARAEGFVPADGVLFDLGFSSLQVDDPDRGFSFRHEGFLDMRFDPTGNEPTAADLVNTLSEEGLVDLFRRYGEEPRSRRFARAIVAARPLETTGQLAGVIEEAAGGQRSRGIHPATRVFQALRIAVNRELAMLEETLPQVVSLLKPGGRLAIITFHSLEDRVVKHFFRQEARGCECPPEAPVCVCGRKPTLRLLTRKPIAPSPEEISVNPRSRSAKLRSVERLGEEKELGA
ncbi:MAG: 16S rRNA (cytosine(1402)-N(4))-methyltransferase RsmH [Anaerolineae bacterium]|nr:16S rRNA (cytosine(1402)-N(4))-methyltransferase RsmH [Anaerolineae bacterium]